MTRQRHLARARAATAVALAAAVRRLSPGAPSGDEDDPPAPRHRHRPGPPRRGTRRRHPALGRGRAPRTLNAFQADADAATATGRRRRAAGDVPARRATAARSSTPTTWSPRRSSSSEPQQVVLVQAQPQGGVERRPADRRRRLRRPVEGAARQRRRVLDRPQRRLRPDRQDRAAAQGRARGQGHLRQALRRLAVAVHPALPQGRHRHRRTPSTTAPAPRAAGHRRALRASEDGGRQGRHVTLVRNPTWWGDRAKLRQARARPRDRPRRQTGRRTWPARRAGRSPDESTPATLATGKKTKGLAVYARRCDAAYTQLALNGTTGPLADERVRHAVARAIDRQAHRQGGAQAARPAREPLGNHLLLPAQDGYADHSSALGSTDTSRPPGPARRRRLAAAARAKAGRRQAAPGPGAAERNQAAPAHRWRSASSSRPRRCCARTARRSTLRFVLPPAPAPRRCDAVGDRIATDAGPASASAPRSPRSPTTSYFKDHIASGDYDLALYSWPATAYPATDARPIFAKPVPAPTAR